MRLISEVILVDELINKGFELEVWDTSRRNYLVHPCPRRQNDMWGPKEESFVSQLDEVLNLVDHKLKRCIELAGEKGA